MSDEFRDVTEVPGASARRVALAQAAHRYAFVASRSVGCDVLEVACGAGMGVRLLTRAGRRVVFGDLAWSNVRDVAAMHPPARVVQLRGEVLPFKDGSFDVVALLEAVYFLEQPDRAVREARRVLRTGGLFMLSTVNPAWRDFQRSPLSRGYFDARDLYALLRAGGFDAEVFAGFRVPTAATARVASLMRRISARGDLPWPSWARSAIRRVLHGQPSTFPGDLPEVDLEMAPMTRIAATRRDADHQILYAVGRVT